MCIILSVNPNIHVEKLDITPSISVNPDSVIFPCSALSISMKYASPSRIAVKTVSEATGRKKRFSNPFCHFLPEEV